MDDEPTLEQVFGCLFAVIGGLGCAFLLAIVILKVSEWVVAALF
jgi:hypothetical protein